MTRFVLILIAAALTLVATPAPANTGPTAADYVRARFAEAGGDLVTASRGYAAALDLMPDDAGLAQRSYRQALAAGDRATALRAARTLERLGKLPADGRLLLLAEAVIRRDWTAAGAETDKVAKEDVFGFLVPIVRAWIATETGARNPLALLDQPAVPSPYVAEHRALLQLARGEEKAGATAVMALGGSGTARTARLRLIAAAALDRAGERESALALLVGEDDATRSARRLLGQKQPLPLKVDGAAAGLSELLTRVALDINRERVTPISVGLARTATFLAPANSEAWLVVSALLAADGQEAAALAALEPIAAEDVFAGAAEDARVRLLMRRDETDQALRIARAAAAGPDAVAADWSRVGDLLSDLGNHREAAGAYEKALRLAEADPASKDGLWFAWLQLGGALEQAEDWKAAKPALERAVALAPEQPVALNYLGYAQLERNENVEPAKKLIERASALRPDDAAITDSLGWAYFLTGDLPRAIETLERAAAGEPGDSEINEHLGDAYWKAGRRYEARHAWAAAQVYADEPAKARLAAKIDGMPARP